MVTSHETSQTALLKGLFRIEIKQYYLVVERSSILSQKSEMKNKIHFGNKSVSTKERLHDELDPSVL